MYVPYVRESHPAYVPTEQDDFALDEAERIERDAERAELERLRNRPYRYIKPPRT